MALASTFSAFKAENWAAAIAGSAGKHLGATWHGGWAARSSLGSPGRRPALLVDLFILLPLKAGWGEEGRGTRTTQSEMKKKKGKLKMWSAWQRPKAQEPRDREKNVSLLSNWMEIRCCIGTSQDL